MFDLQRELKAELDTRIVIVQTLLKQVDHKIEALSTLQANTVETDTSDASSHSRIKELMQRGLNAREIAIKLGLSLNEVEITIAKL